MTYNHPTRAFAAEPEFAREYDDYYADLEPAELDDDFDDEDYENEANIIAEDAAMEAGLFGWDA